MTYHQQSSTCILVVLSIGILNLRILSCRVLKMTRYCILLELDEHRLILKYKYCNSWLTFTFILVSFYWVESSEEGVDLIKPALMSVYLSVHTYVRSSTKSFSDSGEIWYVDKRSVSDAMYAMWPNPRSRSRGTESWKFFPFLKSISSAIFNGK